MIRASHQLCNRVRNTLLLPLHARRLLQFCTVGTSGIVVNMTFFALLRRLGHINGVIAVVLATEAALLSNFILNDRWTFRLQRGERSWLRRALLYNAVCSGGLLISMSVFAFCTLATGLPDPIANLIAIGMGMLWNYAANARLTWGSRHSLSVTAVIPSNATLLFNPSPAREERLPSTLTLADAPRRCESVRE